MISFIDFVRKYYPQPKAPWWGMTEVQAKDYLKTLERIIFKPDPQPQEVYVDKKELVREDVDFIIALNKFRLKVHNNAVDKGFWDNPKSLPEDIALMHSELSEALEGFRAGNPPDKHVPELDNVTVELADCIIRILDVCEYHNLRIGMALLSKHKANTQRERMHGKTI